MSTRPIQILKCALHAVIDDSISEVVASSMNLTFLTGSGLGFKATIRVGLPRLLSLLFALASLASLLLYSASCCLLLSTLARAIAGVGLNPMPFIPSPSSSGSSGSCPVISSSCQVSEALSMSILGSGCIEPFPGAE